MLNKARKRLWALRHVKKAGMGRDDMLVVFNTLIRSVSEFAAPSFHSMLSAEQRDMIENIQKHACKIIYGWDSNYDQLVNIGKIETLGKRREKLTCRGCVKRTLIVPSLPRIAAANSLPETELAVIKYTVITKLFN